MSARVWVIGHRGASAEAPESTEAAIRLAFRMGADAVELDVQVTADHRLIIFHDTRLDRTTNGHGWLRRHRYAQLARLDAGAWFAPRFAGQRILLVEQALRMSAPHRLNLELKATTQPQGLIAGMARLLRHAAVRARVLVSSFDASLLARLRQAQPDVALALLCRARTPWPSALTRAVRLGCTAFHPHVSVVTPTLITRTRAAGLRLHVWTVDEPRTARRLAQWGVQGLFTNTPDRIRKALGVRG
jgi:glycerophosphoryl diester phosphodiesterase